MNRFVIILTYLLLSGRTRFTRDVGLGLSFHLRCNSLPAQLPVSFAHTHINLVRFYISNVKLLSGDNEVWQESNSYHLVDFASGLVDFALPAPSTVQFDRIRFHLGIDSITNVSGVHGGDLDPLKGMYWTWQSGYINFKIEGSTPDAPGSKHEFQFHLGGYAGPNNALQTVELEVKPGSSIKVAFDIDQFMEGVDFAQTHTIMSPGVQSAKLSARAAHAFFVLP